MVLVAGPVYKEESLKNKDQVIKMAHITEPMASPELCPQVAEAMRRVRKAKYPICSMYNVDFRELEDEHKLTHGESLLKSVYLLLSSPLCNA